MHRGLYFIGAIALIASGLLFVRERLGNSKEELVKPAMALEHNGDDLGRPTVESPGEPEDSTPRTARASMPTKGRISAATGDAAPGIFRVHVLGWNGDGIEGATVVWGGRRSKLEQTTNSEGVVEFPRPRSGVRMDLRAEADGMAAVPRSVLSDLGSVRLHLVPVEEVRGRVLDARTGQPLAGVKLSVAQSDGPLRRNSVSNGEGHFEFQALPKGVALRLTARKPGYTTGNLAYSTVAEPSRPTPPLEVRLMAARSLSGHVFDAISGQPLPGAEVQATANVIFESRTSGASGEFLFEDLASLDDEQLRVWVDAPGYCRMHATLHGDAWSSSLPIRLIPAAIVHVSAVDSEGMLLDTAHVRQIPGGINRTVDIPEILSEYVDEGWNFPASAEPLFRSNNQLGPTLDVACVPYSEAIGVFAHHPELAPAGARLPRAGAPGSRLEFQLALHPVPIASESSRIEGTLRINGEPAPGRICGTVGTRSQYGVVGSDGSFLIAELDPGVARLQPLPKGSRLGLYFQGGMPFFDRRPSAEVGNGQLTQVDLDIPLPMGALSGRVHQGENGTPIAGRTLRVESIPWPLEPRSPSRPTPFAETVTDEAGRFEFELPEELAPYRVSLVHGSEVRAIEVPVVPALGLDFELPPTRTIHLRATDPQFQRPARFLEVHVRPLDSEAYREIKTDPAVARTQGKRELDESTIQFDLPLGHYDMLVGYSNRFHTTLESIELAAGEAPFELEVAMPPTFRLNLVLEEGSAPNSRGSERADPRRTALEQRSRPRAPRSPRRPLPRDLRPASPGDPLRIPTQGPGGCAPPRPLPLQGLSPDIRIEPEWVEMGHVDQRVEIRWN